MSSELVSSSNFLKLYSRNPAENGLKFCTVCADLKGVNVVMKHSKKLSPILKSFYCQC